MNADLKLTYYNVRLLLTAVRHLPVFNLNFTKIIKFCKFLGHPQVCSQVLGGIISDQKICKVVYSLNFLLLIFPHRYRVFIEKR
jgi:hypothetical protein